MPGLDADRVRAAAARWVWKPVDASEVLTEDYRLIHHPGVSMVHGSATDRPLGEVLAEVVAHVRAAGRPDALRFWEGSVLPAHRGRGVYRALVARRLVDARPTTAEFALVKAVDDTSAPILKRLGFTPYGDQRCWSLSVGG